MSKKDQARIMFNNISRRYDFLNHLLSFGYDKYWRRRAIRWIRKQQPKTIIDIATGTGDLAIAEAKLPVEKVLGVDIAKNMLEIAKEKVIKKGLSDKITLEIGDAEHLKYKDNSFDVATCAFGVRNFEHVENGLKEIYRVLNPDGTAIILEFSNPTIFPVKQLYRIYFSGILPLIGKILSKHHSAYRYLPETVSAFPHQKVFVDLLKKAGFNQVRYIKMTFGIVTMYEAKKG